MLDTVYCLSTGSFRIDNGKPEDNASTVKPNLHCDISISTSIDISITNAHTCYISTRKVTYASALSFK